MNDIEQLKHKYSYSTKGFNKTIIKPKFLYDIMAIMISII